MTNTILQNRSRDCMKCVSTHSIGDNGINSVQRWCDVVKKMRMRGVWGYDEKGGWKLGLRWCQTKGGVD